MMNAQEIIHYIATAEKKTPVKITLREKAGEAPISFGSAKVFGVGDKVIFGDWKELGPILEANRSKIDDMVIENDCRNSAIPLLDLKGINARIEPGAVIRDQVTIGDGAVIGAGSVVTRDIPPRVIAVGNPCRVLRPVTDRDSVREYL